MSAGADSHRATVFSDRVCALGEGPLWHPGRAQLYWFDILGQRLWTRAKGRDRAVDFDECVSAAGWIDADTVLMATETGLYHTHLGSGARTLVAPLEADRPDTRSNDGRADPWGGFWIGTMGKDAQENAGAIYRYYRGELRKLVPDVTISNAICFAPGGGHAYYTDTMAGQVMRQRLRPADGWPDGAPEVFLDLRDAKYGADGAVVDAQGCLWNAHWGAWRVARYDQAGALLSKWTVPARQVSCPAFGGPDMTTLFVTTAAVGVETMEGAGMTYAIETGIRGQAEHRVIL